MSSNNFNPKSKQFTSYFSHIPCSFRIEVLLCKDVEIYFLDGIVLRAACNGFMPMPSSQELFTCGFLMQLCRN